MERFRLEHNSKPARMVFASGRLSFDATVPIAYHRYSLKMLNQFWNEALNGNILRGWPGIPENMQEEATNKKDVAIRLWKQFNLYQRGNFGPRFNVAQAAMLQALEDCEDDTFHNPTDSDFEDIDGKKKLKHKSSKNESTNVAFARRAMKTYKDRPEGDPFKEATLEAWAEVKAQAISQAHKPKGSLDPDSYGGYWDIDIDNIIANTPLPELPDPPEDLTTYTLVGNDIQNITTLDYDFILLPRNETNLLYRAVNISGNFNHLYDAVVTAGTNRGFAVTWCLADVVKNTKAMQVGGDNALTSIVNISSTGTKSMAIQEIDGGTIYADGSPPWTLSQRYYENPNVVGITYSNPIHTDPDRTVSFDTLSLSLHSAITYTTMYACNCFNDGQSGTLTGNGGNYDFQINAINGFPFFFGIDE